VPLSWIAVEAPLEATLRDEVRKAAQAFLRLLDLTRGLSLELVASIRATADETSRSGAEADLSLALVGDSPAARRALLNAALGEPLVGTAPQRDGRVTVVRHAAAFDYEARSRDVRRVRRFSLQSPDQSAVFEKHIAQAESALAEAHAARAKLAERLEAARAAVAEATAEVERTRRELDAATDEVSRAQGVASAARAEQERTEMIVRRAPTLPSVYVRVPPWWAVWLWFWRLLLAPFLRERLREAAGREAEAARATAALAAQTAEADGAERVRRGREEAQEAATQRLKDRKDAVLELEDEHADTRAITDTTARVDRLRRERDAYVAERKTLFAAALRDIDAASARGDELLELTIDYPSKHLPEGLTILDLPSPARVDGRAVAESTVRRDADAFVLVADAARPAGAATTSLVEALASSVPRLLLPPQPKGGAAFDVAFFARLAGERELVSAVRAAMRIRGCVAELARARESAEESHQRRLEALERQRIPHPTEFRAAQVTRMQSAIEKAADDSLAAAIDRVRASIATLRSDWTGRITQATGRSAIDAVIKEIDETSAARVSEAMEKTSELVARELQTHAESLETWALEEIHARYQVARRFGAEQLSPVASELTREDLERGMFAGPVSGAMDTFEKGRVGIGLGGVAAGALIGTLIFPGIGTAIGAFVGVFAGFLKGTDSLKQDCLAKIEASLGDIEAHAVAQLQAKRPDLGRVLRVSVDESLREALDLLDKAISRLLEVEKRAIEGERAKLEELRAARAALDEHDAKLAKLVGSAMTRLDTKLGGGGLGDGGAP
jgi:hypothetical protein